MLKKFRNSENETSSTWLLNTHAQSSLSLCCTLIQSQTSFLPSQQNPRTPTFPYSLATKTPIETSHEKVKPLTHTSIVQNSCNLSSSISGHFQPLGLVWLRGWKSERIENGERMKIWGNRKDFNPINCVWLEGEKMAGLKIKFVQIYSHNPIT